jgi:hypothetical protein
LSNRRIRDGGQSQDRKLLGLKIADSFLLRLSRRSRLIGEGVDLLEKGLGCTLPE